MFTTCIIWVFVFKIILNMTKNQLVIARVKWTFCSALLLARPWSLITSTAVKLLAWGGQKTILMCDCRAVTWTGMLQLVWSHSSSHWKLIHLWAQRPSQTTFTSPGLLRSCVRQILVSRFIQILSSSELQMVCSIWARALNYGVFRWIYDDGTLGRR